MVLLAVRMAADVTETHNVTHIVNLSRCQLNNVETTALNNGLQFLISPQHFDFLQT